MVVGGGGEVRGGADVVVWGGGGVRVQPLRTSLHHKYKSTEQFR